MTPQEMENGLNRRQGGRSQRRRKPAEATNGSPRSMPLRPADSHRLDGLVDYVDFRIVPAAVETLARADQRFQLKCLQWTCGVTTAALVMICVVALATGSVPGVLISVPIICATTVGGAVARLNHRPRHDHRDRRNTP